MLGVEFIVINEETNMDDFFNTYQSGVILTIEEYENLSVNMQEFLRYIRQMNELVDLYEGYSDIIP